ncbi:MAG TPA: YetF domain-containing protein [Solimonas sp.]|nr:YetF domain-containing protein [Solimonas sp.]
MSDWAKVDWHALFVPSGSLVEIVIRGSAIYLFLFFLMRVLRRETGQFNIADLLVIVIIADAAQNGMAGTYESITEGLVLIVTIMFWNYGLDWAGYHFESVRKLVQPSPVTLVRNGRIDWRQMRRELITETELMGRLHNDGIQQVEDVYRCFVETDGKLSVISNEQARKNAARRKARTQ